MTFDEYIYSPAGKGNTSMPLAQRQAWKEIYQKKYDQIFLREAGKIKYTLHMDKKKNLYVAYIHIPSEVVKNFYYDVVIEFSSDHVQETTIDLKKYDVRFFSNDPAFVFTYLKVFRDHDMFIEWLKKKEPKLALKEDPKVRNPYKIPGYVKSIYFAYLFMKHKNLFVKKNYDIYAVPLKPKEIEKLIVPADIKIQQRQELGREVEKNKKKSIDSTIDKKENSKKTMSNPNKSAVRMVSSVKNTKSVKKTPKTRTTRRTGKK